MTINYSEKALKFNANIVRQNNTTIHDYASYCCVRDTTMKEYFDHLCEMNNISLDDSEIDNLVWFDMYLDSDVRKIHNISEYGIAEMKVDNPYEIFLMFDAIPIKLLDHVNNTKFIKLPMCSFFNIFEDDSFEINYIAEVRLSEIN